jgi:RNA polymerase sigma-70 factor (ECF subfamily)
MNDVETFSRHRPLLFSIAYRMLGSVMDAEDAVQDAYLRWQQAPQDDVRSPKSYLSTVVTRLCIDQLRSARTKREQYIGPWLPEPLVTEETTELDDKLALSDSVSMAFLVLLESLSPVERAAFLLRDVFEYPYGEIARIVDKSEANCRQMVHRARDHVASRRHRFDASREQAEELMWRFLRASASGDNDALVSMLTSDVTLWSDGGGKVAAALNPIYGAEKVARFFTGLAAKQPADMQFRVGRVNGDLGIISYAGVEPYAVFSIELEGERVRGVRIVVNPEKLQHVPPLGA